MRNENLRHVRRAQRGMTLIEIMVVVAIISMILGGVGLMAFNRYKGAQVDVAKKNAIEIQSAVEMYMLQRKNKCPKTLADLKAAGTISKSIQDPWGGDYEIKCPGQQLDVDVISAGPDREMGTEDDIANYGDDVAEEAEES